MIRRQLISPRTYTLFPYPTLFRSCLPPGADLPAAAPAREPRGGGPTEEQRMAEQRLNFAFDLGRDIGDHAAHLLDPARARGDRIEVVADRLLARQLRNRAEDRLEEARRAGLVAFGEVDLHARRGVDVNEAAIDRTPGRAFPQRVDRGLEDRKSTRLNSSH